MKLPNPRHLWLLSTCLLIASAMMLLGRHMENVGPGSKAQTKRIRKDSPIDQPSRRPTSANKSQLSRLLEINKCIEPSPDCPFSETDPRSFELEKNKQIARILKATADELDEKTRRQVIRAFYQTTDPFIQQALLIHIEQDKTPTIPLDWVVRLLNHTTSVHVMKQATYESLRRAQSPRQVHQVFTSLARQIKTGPLTASSKLVQAVKPLIGKNNYELFRRTASELPPHSGRRMALEQALREYQLITSP